MPRYLRLFALVACTALVATACNRNKPKSTDAPTDAPEPTPSVQSIGEFQLVATIEQAFLSIGPGIDLPADVTGQAEQGAEQDVANVNGVMRGELEAFSDNLRDRCGADEGDRFNIFWTRGTFFDESLLDGSLESELEGRRVGVIGTIFLRAAGESDSGEFNLDQGSPAATTAPPATTPPRASPGVTTGEGEDNCVLVVDQVGISRGALPTARPSSSPGRTASPAPTATRSPTPTPRRTATPSPTPVTPSPSPTAPPTASPTPTST